MRYLNSQTELTFLYYNIKSVMNSSNRMTFTLGKEIVSNTRK